MLLTFSRKEFETLIKQGVKIHTIRQDKHNRWKPGRKIHFWLGNPRNVKKHPYQFGEGKCTDVAFIEIFPKKNMVRISYDGVNYGTFCKIQELNELAVDDGFTNWEHMKEWFSEDFKGKMIFWKSLNCVWL